MFEQTFVKDGVETEGSHKEVQQVTADVRDDQQAQQLSDWFIFWPIRAIDIRGQEVVIGQIQHDIHGNGLIFLLWRSSGAVFPPLPGLLKEYRIESEHTQAQTCSQTRK